MITAECATKIDCLLEGWFRGECGYGDGHFVEVGPNIGGCGAEVGAVVVAGRGVTPLSCCADTLDKILRPRSKALPCLRRAHPPLLSLFFNLCVSVA